MRRSTTCEAARCARHTCSRPGSPGAGCRHCTASRARLRCAVGGGGASDVQRRKRVSLSAPRQSMPHEAHQTRLTVAVLDPLAQHHEAHLLCAVRTRDGSAAGRTRRRLFCSHAGGLDGVAARAEPAEEPAALPDCLSGGERDAGGRRLPVLTCSWLKISLSPAAISASVAVPPRPAVRRSSVAGEQSRLCRTARIASATTYRRSCRTSTAFVSPTGPELLFS